jgi:L-ascorbate metabolism protein UlaG (beta-lactamase superfamily)
MEIKYLGHSSFLIRGKKNSLVTDPYDSDMTGLRFPKHISSDVVTVSHDHPDHNAVSQVEGDPFIVGGPGEFEVKGIFVIGYRTFHDDTKGQARGMNTIYRIELDGLSMLHLGDLGHQLSDADLEAIGGVDILFVPVGGLYSLTPEQADSVVKEIEPTIVIPMHYMREGLNTEHFGSLVGVEEYLKVSGKTDTVPIPKLTITKDKLPPEMQVVVLE